LDDAEPSNGVTVTIGGLEATDRNLLVLGLTVVGLKTAGFGAIGTYLLLLPLGLSAEAVENNCLLTLDGTGDE